MRLKVPFLGYMLAFVGLLLPPAVFAALLPSLINAQPVRERLIAQLSEWTGGQVEVTGSVSAENYFSLSVELSDVTITQFSMQPVITSVKAQKIQARVSSLDLMFGDLSFDKIKISGAIVNVNAKDPREAAATVLTMLSGRQENGFATFVLNDSIVAMRDGPGDPYRSLHIDSAWAAVEKPSGVINATGGVRWDNEPFEFSVRKERASAQEARAPLKLRVDGPLFSGEFNGESNFSGEWRATGSVKLRTTDAMRFYGWLGLDAQSATTDGFALKGQLDMMAEQASLQSAEFTLGKQSASGNVTAKFSGNTPRLEGKLTFGDLDLDLLFNGDKGAVRLLPLAATSDVDFRISAETVKWRGIQTGTAAFTLTSGPGRLIVEVAELEFMDGSVRGHLGAETGGAPLRLQARLNAEGVNAASFLALLQQRDWLSGNVDANIEADLSLSPEGEILDASTGRARISFSDGGQIRLDIPGLVDAAAAGPMDGWGTAASANASFDDLRLALSLQNGRVRCDNLELQASRGRVTGMGSFNLADQSVDARLEVAPEVAARERRASTAAVTTPVEPRAGVSIRGAWSHPVIRAEMSQTGDLTGSHAKAAAALEVRDPGR